MAKAVLVAAIPPLMLKTDHNPEGTPLEVFDGFRAALAANRPQSFRDVPSGPFYGFNREGATVHEGVIQNWWRQGMMGSAKAHYDGIETFSETDQTEDLRAITVPTLVLHGEDDQIVPIAASALKAIELLSNGTLKTVPRPLAWHADRERRCTERRSPGLRRRLRRERMRPCRNAR